MEKDCFWSGDADDGLWDSAANWEDLAGEPLGGIPADGDSAYFVGLRLSGSACDTGPTVPVTLATVLASAYAGPILFENVTTGTFSPGSAAWSVDGIVTTLTETLGGTPIRGGLFSGDILVKFAQDTRFDDSAGYLDFDGVDIEVANNLAIVNTGENGVDFSLGINSLSLAEAGADVSRIVLDNLIFSADVAFAHRSAVVDLCDNTVLHFSTVDCTVPTAWRRAGAILDNVTVRVKAASTLRLGGAAVDAVVGISVSGGGTVTLGEDLNCLQVLTYVASVLDADGHAITLAPGQSPAGAGSVINATLRNREDGATGTGTDTGA